MGSHMKRLLQCLEMLEGQPKKTRQGRWPEVDATTKNQQFQTG
jgi:hypothetical protein